MKYDHFGLWLKAKLKKHEVVQAELARQICVAQNTVAAWSCGQREPSIRNFIWICRYIAVLEDTDTTSVIEEAERYF